MRLRPSLALALAAATLVATPLALSAGDEPEVVKKTRADLPNLKKALEGLRSTWKFTGDVAIKHQTDEEFRAFMQEELDKEFPPAKAGATTRALAKLGLLPEGYDIRKEIVDVMAGQALAHYNPKNKTFFVLKTDMPDAMVGQTMIHELHHALQDQHADLKGLYDAASKADDEDWANALKFLVEGEATYIMTIYELKKQGMEAQAMQLLKMQATMPREQMQALEEQQLGMLGDKAGSMKKALEQRAKLPSYIYRGLIDPYMKGAYMVAQVKESGGWDAVDALWKEPPRSTSQALRPKRKLIGDAREDPTLCVLDDLSSKVGGGFKKTFETTVGELNIEVLLTDHLGSDADLKPARGWYGDRVHAYEADGKGPTVVWFSTWTKPDFAKRFGDAYGEVLDKRFEKAKAAEAKVGGKTGHVRKDGETSHAIVADGADLVIVLGCPNDSLDAVVTGAFAAKKTVSAKHPAKPGKD